MFSPIDSVKVSPRAVRIVFGQVGETEVSFHTAVVMTRRNAVALAEAIQKLSAKSKGPDVRKATGSGGTCIRALWQRGTMAAGLQASYCSALVAKGSEADDLRPLHERTLIRFGSFVDVRVALLKSFPTSIV